MLQITEYNMKLGLEQKHGPLDTTARAWASARGENGHSPSPPFWKLGLRTTNF